MEKHQNCIKTTLGGREKKNAFTSKLLFPPEKCFLQMIFILYVGGWEDMALKAAAVLQ